MQSLIIGWYMMIESLGQNYMKIHQFERVFFAVDSKLNLMNCSFCYLFNNHSRIRPSEYLFSHSAMLPRTQSVSFSYCFFISSLFLPQCGFHGFKYHVTIPSNKKGFFLVILEGNLLNRASGHLWSEWGLMATLKQLLAKGNEICITDLNWSSLIPYRRKAVEELR